MEVLDLLVDLTHKPREGESIEKIVSLFVWAPYHVKGSKEKKLSKEEMEQRIRDNHIRKMRQSIEDEGSIYLT